MVYKWKTKEKVKNLRKKGLSYREIQKSFPIAKSTISLWCQEITLTPKQKGILNKRYDTQRRGAQANRLKRQEEIKKIKRLARQEIRKFSKDPFKVAGLMLYWGEGSKTHYVGISNSDPDLISFMMRWFRKVFNIPENKFKAYLNLHSGQNEMKVKTFWSKITKFPVSQFGKTYIKPEGVGFKKNILYNGTIKVIVCNKDLLYRILALIEEYRNYCEKNA